MRMLATLILASAIVGTAAAQVVPAPSAVTTEPKAKSKPPVVRIPIEDDANEPAQAAPKSEPSEPAAKQAKPEAKKGAKKDPEKKEEEIGKIEGIEIARSGDRYLGIEIVDGNYKLNFYDEKKKPVPPDVGRAALRWDPKYKLGMERVVLVPGGGPNSLTAARFIRPPYNFKLTIVLLGEAPDGGEGAEPGGETHVIDFRQ